MKKYQAKILFFTLAYHIYINDIFPHVINFLRGAPVLKGFVFLGSNVGVKNILLNNLNKENLHFNILGDEKNLPKCEQIIETNNVFIHSYKSKEFPIEICNNFGNNVFKSIEKLVSLPFYFRWFDYSNTNFELSGCYNNFTEGDITASLIDFPVGSTMLITSSVGQPLLQSIKNEVFLESFTRNNNTPYIRFIKYLISNPDNNLFAVNTGAQVDIFKTDIDSLSDFSDSGVTAWQISQVQNFIQFFKSISESISNVDMKQFSQFINLNIDGIANIESWVSNAKTTDRFKEMLLFNYIGKNNIHKVQDLLSVGVPIDSKTMTGTTPISAASFLDNIEMMQVLIKFGAMNDKTQHTCSNPLISAIINNSLQAAKLLLQVENNPDFIDCNGNTPLIIAASKGYTDMVDLLLIFSANSNIQNSYNQTPLTIASALGYVEIVTKLLKVGANISLVDNASHTAFFLASLNNHTDIAQMFVSDNKYLITNLLLDGHDIAETITSIDHLIPTMENEQRLTALNVIECLYTLDFESSYINLFELCGEFV